MTVQDNVRFAFQFGNRRHQDSALIAEVLAATQIDALHAELAGALATSPRLLLLDEVAAGLTEGEVEEVARLITRLRERYGLTVVWIEHAVGTLMRTVERVAVLNFGQLLADGSPAQVAAEPKVINAYLGDEVTA